jgi:CheY-like chemotaxis protein
MARFEIEDSGPGMGPQEMEHIFEPFVRGSAHTGGSLAGGSGLGLTISKMLTDLMGGEMTVSSTPGVGTLFRIKLFLPQVRAAVAERELPRTGRTGYLGERKRVLVVDNEEVDRELLASVLQPLGFELQQAANGEDCLALLESGAMPDAILMDLAMPGLDGWGTLRQIRLRGLSDAPVAIVSANAFDKGLENDVGVRSEDFIVKPVRVSELLDWLGARLSLQWLHAAPPPAVARPAVTAYPPAQHLRALEELVTLGYFRGIVSKLDEIEAAHPDSAAFVDKLRLLARGFQLEAMSTLIQQALPDVEPTA